MNRLFYIGLLTMIFYVLTSCNGQNQNTIQSTTQKTGSHKVRIGGECEEGYCELIYFGMPREIKPVDTSAGWFEKGQKLMVTGTVYKRDGKTPVPNVIVYYHHTDNDGYYSRGNDKPENQTRHGHIRGWVKTNDKGEYSIYTIRPAPYPNESIPAHIHIIIKEPNIENEYWIDDLVFDDDKLLIPYRKKYPETAPRCGSGLLRVLLKDSLQIAEHNFILGLNIPNHPENIIPEKQSGLNIGEGQPSFDPIHAYGPDKGSHACPVCKYGRYQGILYFVGDNPDWKEIKQWLLFLEKESIMRQKYLKVFFIYGNEKAYNRQDRLTELETIGKELSIRNTALTFVPSFSDGKSNINLSKIIPTVENTFIIYKHRTIIDKYMDLKPTPDNFKLIVQSLERSKGKFYDLPEPKHE